jgi:hypothetical protein
MNIAMCKATYKNIMMTTSMGWDYVSELRPPTCLLFVSRWYMSMQNRGGMLPTEENSWFVHQSSLATLPADHLVAKQEELSEVNDEFGLRNIFVHTSKWYLAYHKILRHRANAFTSRLKEGVLRIFIAIINPSPWPNLNQRSLGPVANIPTNTPPRLLLYKLKYEHYRPDMFIYFYIYFILDSYVYL